MATKHAIIEEKLAKYLKVSKEGKSKLLNHICKIAGLHRNCLQFSAHYLTNLKFYVLYKRLAL